MEPTTVRTIDELGRVAVPKDIRLAMGWDAGTKVKFCAHRGLVIIEEDRLSVKKGSANKKGAVMVSMDTE